MEQTHGIKREKETPRSSRAFGKQVKRKEDHSTQSSIVAIPRRHLTGRVVGALVLTCFSILWGLQSSFLVPRIILVIVPVVALILIFLSLITMRAVRRLPPEELTPEARARYRQTIRRFWIVVIVEFAAIAAAILLFNFVDHPEYIGPTIGLIVGLHFLPLASFFQVRVYTLLGVATSLVAGVAILALLSGLTPGDLGIWSAIVELGIVVIFWLTALFNLWQVRQILSLRSASSQP